MLENLQISLKIKRTMGKIYLKTVGGELGAVGGVFRDIKVYRVI
jgi:hypothetical protein